MRIGSKRRQEKQRIETMSKELPTWLNGLLIFGTMATVVLAEIRRPLRVQKHDKRDRR